MGPSWRGLTTRNDVKPSSEMICNEGIFSLQDAEQVCLIRATDGKKKVATTVRYARTDSFDFRPIELTSALFL